MIDINKMRSTFVVSALAAAYVVSAQEEKLGDLRVREDYLIGSSSNDASYMSVEAKDEFSADGFRSFLKFQLHDEEDKFMSKIEEEGLKVGFCYGKDTEGAGGVITRSEIDTCFMYDFLSEQKEIYHFKVAPEDVEKQQAQD